MVAPEVERCLIRVWWGSDQWHKPGCGCGCGRGLGFGVVL